MEKALSTIYFGLFMEKFSLAAPLKYNAKKAKIGESLERPFSLDRLIAEYVKSSNGL